MTPQPRVAGEVPACASIVNGTYARTNSSIYVKLSDDPAHDNAAIICDAIVDLNEMLKVDLRAACVALRMPLEEVSNILHELSRLARGIGSRFRVVCTQDEFDAINAGAAVKTQDVSLAKNEARH